MAVIVFDFDGVADDKVVQALIKKLVKEGNEIWVVTARCENDYSKRELKPVLEVVGLTEYNIIYCNDRPKLEMLQMLKADIYIDNHDSEFYEILNYSNTIPLLFQSKN